jgi:hypothetical protein
MASRVLELRLGFLLGLLSGRCAFAASARGVPEVGRLSCCTFVFVDEARGVSEVGSSLLASGYQQVRSVVAVLAGDPAGAAQRDQGPPAAAMWATGRGHVGHRPRPCGPPTETCSPSPAAANSPGPFPSAHRYGGGRQRGGLEAHRAMSGLDQRPASGAPTRTQADQLGDTVNTSRPAASDAGGSRGRSRSPWRHRRSSWWWCYHPRRRCWACWSMASQSGRSVQAGSAIGCHPPARLVSTRSRSASST